MVNIDNYAVFGNPIGHSLSPKIHTLFSKQVHDPITYEAILIEIDKFEISVKNFFNAKGKGLSITVPFKLEAWNMAEIKTYRARLAQSTNTLYKNVNGLLVGDNTDGLGLINDLKNNQNIELENKTILIIGAGGATRGVLGPLLNANPKSVTVSNRTKHRAKELIASFNNLYPIDLKACSLNEVNQVYDIIINATSAGISGSIPEISSSIIGNTTICYDMFYNLKKKTPFNFWAEKNNARLCIDGLGMLVEQAAEQFSLWRNKRPATAEVLKELRSPS